MCKTKWSFEQDIEDIVFRCKSIWSLLDNRKIFITGGTGFIGRWLLESLYNASTTLNLNIKAVVLTRDINSFTCKASHLTHFENFVFEEGDVRNFLNIDTDFDYVIHAATDASAELNEHNPKLMFDTILDGTRQVLDFALKNHVKKVLFISSGAIYGQQPWDMHYVPEDWKGSLDCTNPRNTYAEAKRAAELLCAIYIKQFNLNISTARIFSTIGPYMPLNTHFAIGNFILNAIENKEIIVKGNGLPCRSFLYITDLTSWLWNILIFGESGKAYNVGSKESISIKDLAKTVSETLHNSKYSILNQNDQGWNLGRYVPDNSLIIDELKVQETVSLKEAIYRTALWNGWKNFE